MLRRITYWLDGRLYEWTMSVASLALAIEILIWPDTIRASAFVWTADMMSGRTVSIIMFMSGFMRCFALTMNGMSNVVGPVIRSFWALVSAIMWAQFAYALYLLGVSKLAPSPGVPFWTCFVLAELYVSYRAMVDVRRIL